MRHAFVILFLSAFIFRAEAQLTYQNLYVDYDSAWQYKNLKIVPIRWKGRGPWDYPLNGNLISLGEAVNKGYARISERGTASTDNVHWLIIENLSKKNIFVASGDIIAGGRQDRMISRDTLILASQQRMQVPVMCVEEGRWSEKEKKFTYSDKANLRLRKVLDRSKNQVMIWREIYDQLDRTKVKNSTLAYISRKDDKKYVEEEQGYWKFFREKFKKSDSTIVGVVCISGKNVIGCDVFASTSLFYSELESVMFGYIQEAIVLGAPINITDVKIKTYMDKLLMDEVTQEEFIKLYGKEFRYNGRLYHITTYQLTDR
jgi:hypothetical protein